MGNRGRLWKSLDKSMMKQRMKAKKRNHSRKLSTFVIESIKMGLTSVDNSGEKNNIFYDFHKRSVEGVVKQDRIYLCVQPPRE